MDYYAQEARLRHRREARERATGDPAPGRGFKEYGAAARAAGRARGYVNSGGHVYAPNGAYTRAQGWDVWADRMRAAGRPVVLYIDGRWHPAALKGTDNA